MKKSLFVLTALSIIALCGCNLQPPASSSSAQSSPDITSSTSLTESSDTSEPSSDTSESKPGSSETSDTSSQTSESNDTSSQTSDPSSDTGTGESSSSSSSQEEPPITDKITVDLTAPVSHVAHAKITHDQVKALFAHVMSEEYVDEYLGKADQVVAIDETIDSLGFSYEDLNTIFEGIEFLTKDIQEDAPAEIYFAELFQKMRAFASVFSAEKLMAEGNGDIAIHPFVFNTPDFLSNYGIYSYAELDRLIEEASGSEKDTLIALRGVAARSLREYTLNIPSADLVRIGRLIEGYIKSALEHDPEYLAYFFLSITGRTWAYQNAAPGTARAKIIELREKYSGAAANVSSVGSLFTKIEMGGASYSEIFRLLSEIYDISGNVTTFVSPVSNLGTLEAIQFIYEDLKDVVSGEELKALFEFLYEIMAAYTPEFEKQVKDAEKPQDVLTARYDELFGALSSEQKGLLRSLAGKFGLDFDSMAEGLIGLSNLPEGATVSDTLQTIFQPVIDRYEKVLGLDNESVGISYYGPSPLFLENETPTAEELCRSLYAFDMHYGRYLEPETVELVGEPSVSGNLRSQRVKATFVNGEKTSVVEINVRYWALPTSLAGAEVFTGDNLIGYFDASAFSSSLKDRAISGNAYSYDPESHSIVRSYKSYAYDLSQLPTEHGWHNVSLSDGDGHQRNFIYYVFDGSDIKYSFSVSGGSAQFIGGKIVLVGDAGASAQLPVRATPYVDAARPTSSSSDSPYPVKESRYTLYARTIATKIDLPSLSEGQSGVVTILGEEYEVYRATQSDFTQTRLSFSVKEGPNVGFVNDNFVALAQEGMTSEALLQGMYYSAYYEYRLTIGGSTYYGSKNVSARDIRLVGFDSSLHDGILHHAKAVYGTAEADFRYAVVAEEDALLASSTRQIGGATALAGSWYVHYEFLLHGEATSESDPQEEYRVAMSYGESVTITPSMVEGAPLEPGENSYEVTLGDGRKATLYYEYIPFAECEIVFESDYVSLHTLGDGTLVAVKRPDYLRILYNGREVGNRSLYFEPTDLTPGEHVYATQVMFGGVPRTIEVPYEVSNDIELELMPYGEVAFGVTDTPMTVNMEARAVVTFDEVTHRFHTSDYQLTVDASTVGLHHAKSAEGSPVSYDFEYVVYDPQSVAWEIEGAVQSGYATLESTSVSFNVTAVGIADLGEGNTYEIRQTFPYTFPIPEEERTVGTHEALLNLGMFTYRATYVISEKRVSEVSLNDLRLESNVVAIGQDIVVSEAYLNVTYLLPNGSTTSTGRYYSGDQIQVEADVSHATDGFVLGHVVIDGNSFAFQYLVYDPENATSFFETTSESGVADYFVGNLREGNEMSWSTYGVPYVRLSGGDAYALTSGQVRVSHNVVLTASDVTVGEHTVRDGESEFRYVIHGFTDPDVTIISATLEGQKEAYLVGERPRLYLYLRYTYQGGYERSVYLSEDELSVTGFDVSSSSNGQMRQATVSYYDFSMTFDYLVYEQSELGEEREYEFTSTSNSAFVYLEGGVSDTIYCGGRMKVYGYVGSTRVVIDEYSMYLSFVPSSQEEGEHLATATYNGTEFTLPYTVLSVTDERLMWDEAYIEGNGVHYDYGKAANPDGKYDINAVTLNGPIEDVRLSGVYYVDGSGSRVYLSDGRLTADCPVLTGFSNSESTSGEIRVATFTPAMPSYDGPSRSPSYLTYLVYGEDEVIEKTTVNPAGYLYGSEWIDNYAEVEYVKYVALAGGDRYVFIEGNGSFYLTIPDYTGEPYTQDIAYSETVSLWTDDGRIEVLVEGVLKAVKLEECEKVGVVSYYQTPQETLYQGLPYSLTVYGLEIQYRYGERTLQYEYPNLPEGGLTFALDTAEAGRHVLTFEFEGVTYEYSYDVYPVNEMTYLRLQGYDGATGVLTRLSEGATLTVSTGTAAIVVNSDWTDAKILVEGDVSYQYKEGVITLKGEEGSHDIVIKNGLYPDFSYPLTVVFGKNQGPVSAYIDLYDGAPSWRYDGTTYTSATAGIDDSDAVLTFVANQAGEFTFGLTVDSESFCDRLELEWKTWGAQRYYEHEEYSGSEATSLTLSLLPGATVTFTYHKDGSESAGADLATVTLSGFTPSDPVGIPESIIGAYDEGGLRIRENAVVLNGTKYVDVLAYLGEDGIYAIPLGDGHVVYASPDRGEAYDETGRTYWSRWTEYFAPEELVGKTLTTFNGEQSIAFTEDSMVIGEDSYGFYDRYESDGVIGYCLTNGRWVNYYVEYGVVSFGEVAYALSWGKIPEGLAGTYRSTWGDVIVLSGNTVTWYDWPYGVVDVREEEGLTILIAFDGNQLLELTFDPNEGTITLDGNVYTPVDE